MSHGNNTNNLVFPSFEADPTACLQAILSHTPCWAALHHLAGRMAATMKEGSVGGAAAVNPTIALLYLQACARHLWVAVLEKNQPGVAAGAGKAPSGQQSPMVVTFGGTTTTGPQPFVLPLSGGATAHDSSYMVESPQSLCLNEVTEALCYAALRCQPKSGISESGILTVLERLVPNNKTTNNINSNNNPFIRPGAFLTPLHADILHIFLCAGKAQEAQRRLVSAEEWPRPSRGLGAIVLLRYFYLRGLVHIECHNWEWAMRCFWTVLCIPADATSAIVVGAWKKLVLLQGLSQSDRLPTDMTALKMPKTTPICVSRFISQAINSAAAPTTTTNTTGSPQGSSSSQGENASSVIAVAPEDVTAPSGSFYHHLTHHHELMVADEAAAVASLVERPPHGSRNGAMVDSGVRAYSDLVRAFVKVNREAFRQILHDNWNQFVLDGNLPLVKLLEADFVKRQIYQWSRVVSVISLERLSELICIPVGDLPNTLREIAAKDQWNIEIQEDPHHHSTTAYFPKHVPTRVGTSSNHSAELAKLTELMQTLDISLSTSSKFLSLVRRDNANAPEKAMGPRGVEDI